MTPSHHRGATHSRTTQLVRALLAPCLAILTTFAFAIQPVTPDQRAAHAKLPRAFVAPELDVQPEIEATESLAIDRPGADAAGFVQRYGGTWEMRRDRRSDRPELVQGSGIPLVPGAGNSLTLAALGLAANERIDLALVETRLQDFIAANEDLLKTKGFEFALDPNSSIAYGKNDSHWFIEFAQLKDGVRVEGANLFFRVAAGNIVQFGAYRVAPVSIDVQPVSTRENALDLALREIAFPAGTHVVDLVEAGELLVLPVLPAGEAPHATYSGSAGNGYEHRLAWRFVFRVDDDQATYQVLFDAKTNRVIEVRDLNDYVNATVTGGIYPTTNSDPEVVKPMPFVAVTNGGAKVTDALGIYDYSGGTATTALDGKYFKMVDSCGSISLSNATDGNLALGTSGGTDCTTPGVGGAGNTHASRTGFYHLTNINRKAITFFPSNAWLQSKVTANMNLNQLCNAYWDGSTLNFFRSGGGCSNTGEIAAVFLHEWGHGMDTNSGGAASEYGSGEAVGDTFAFLETKDSCIGKNFEPGSPCPNCPASCTGVRDVGAFSTLGAATVARPSTVTDNAGINCDQYIGGTGVACPYIHPTAFVPYQGPMGYEGHCESYIASSANWDLAQKLVTKWGTTQGWSEMDRIWYGSLTPSKSAYRIASGGQCNPSANIDGCGSNNWYTVFLAADDDDGNLANGTPNGCRIWDAFSAHGIACGTRPACSADAPDFTLAIAEASQSICAPASTTYTVDVGSQMGFGNPVTLSANGLPAGVSAAFSANPVAPGGSSIMTLTASGSAVAGTSTITVNGTAASSPGHSATSQLALTTGAPSTATPTAPANGATAVGTAPTLAWSAGANTASYTVEIATDAAFANIVQTLPGITATSVAVSGLLPTTTYYWRVKGVNACGATTSPVSSFTTANMICRAPHVSIPDNDATGVTDSVVVADASTITGLKLSIKAAHTYVGDLAFTLTRGSSVLVINHPTNGGGSCSGNDVDVVLDDAATTTVQSQCNSTPPALSGTLKPNALLGTAFNGQSLAGTWNLKVVDNAAQDTGTLDEWCLIPTTSGGGTTYTVGGSVNGLTGSGLVLSLNAGAQTLPVATNGAFTFPTGLADGAAYAVTIGTQPSGQTCSVASGSGTIAGANVTNVAVTCATNTYTIGGTVGGLAGSGLVLSLNSGAQTLPVAANGAFAFPTGLADGAAYAVTIGTQPTGQTCSVANGSGTVAATNVTNVAVTCATNTYTIGGTVGGLAGSGLMLSLNAGAQTLPVAANGAFAFPTGLADGAAYAVTIGTQPTGQTCSVANGSGTVAAANVTNVAVSCTTNTYTVGGTVGGLLGNSVTLSLNAGAQTVSVSNNGGFVFPTGLAGGAVYAVTVSTQPSAPAMRCTVANGSGTIAAADVTDVAVTCTDTIFANGLEAP